MIPSRYIENVKDSILWQRNEMIEQDMIISRALISLFENEHIRDTLVFRGGTALNKVYLSPSSRYSEDIDFVQLKPGPIGPTTKQIIKCMEWLGTPQTKLGERGLKVFYKFENVKGNKSKLKIEINTTEHFSSEPLSSELFEFHSNWYSGSTNLMVFSFVEIMATKLRALYQRRKGRDLFDIWYVFSQNLVPIDEVIEIFKKYNEYNGVKVTSKMFKQNMSLKQKNRDFREDMIFLLPKDKNWDFDVAYEYVIDNVVPLI